MGAATGFAYYKVASVEKFIEVFTSEPVETWRRENGITSWRVFRFADEPDKVAVMAEYPSIEALQAFRSHPRTRESMADAGMLGPPTFLELQEAKRG